VLEQLGDAEEELGCFAGRKPLSGIEEEGNLCKEDSTSARLDVALVE